MGENIPQSLHGLNHWFAEEVRRHACFAVRHVVVGLALTQFNCLIALVNAATKASGICTS